MRFLGQKFKTRLAWLMLGLLSWSIVFQATYTIYWKINQEEITNLFCENKDKPTLHCDGTCYLAKQIKKAENQEGQFPEILKKLNLDVVYIMENMDYRKLDNSNAYDEDLVAFPFPQISTYRWSLGGIFKPPQS